MKIDSGSPHSARMFDYLLGGSTHFEADREMIHEMCAPLPGGVEFGRTLARRNRAFMARVVRYLAEEKGICQFLDIGAGIPTSENTHEVAQEVEPTSRVVYVDNDPIVLAYAHERLGSTPEGACDYVHTDLHDADQIVKAAGDTLDFDRPIALLLMTTLCLVADDHDPRGAVARLVDAIPSGSYVVVSDPTAEILSSEMTKMAEIFTNAGATMILRSREEIGAFLQGLELVGPGIVLLEDWRPDADRHEVLPLVGGVARKP